MSTLREQLYADGEYFKRILSLIPANYCVDNVEHNALETDTGRTSGGEIEKRVDVCDDLRDSLHKKIEELKSKRIKHGASLDPEEKKRLKRKLSKAKLRQRRKVANQKAKGHLPAGDASAKSETVTKQVSDKDSKVIFSKFDFAESNANKKRKRVDVPTGKNYKVLLKQAKKKKEKMSEAEIQSKDQAQEITKKEIWKSALLKAEGVKVKDNPELLKKAVRRREHKKKSSQRKWEERTKTLAKQTKDRQDKRARNIAKKKEGRANKKIQKAKKRGRVVVKN